MEHGREEGRGGGGIWESEGGERQGRVEREKKYTREQQPKREKKELQRNGLLAGALAPSNRNRACDSEVTYTANLCKGRKQL